MGAFDGAEVCELVGIFLLFQISQYYNKLEFGLYRDDGLAVFKKKSGPQMEQIKKHIVEIFKSNDLNISIKCNMKIVNYLDVTLNLIDCTFKPYFKPDNLLTYIHAESNHPPSIIKQIPHSVELRLSTNSSNEKIFQKTTPLYTEALLKSGYKCTLSFQPKTFIPQNKNKNRARNIIWYNPPFGKNVSTNVGKSFLRLIDRHFPKNNKLHKIFNRNTIKVSYSCMPSIKSVINSHNKYILNNHTTANQENCNCLNRNTCPLFNKCLTNNIVYQATVISDNHDNFPNEKSYIGVSETPFKLRYANHVKSFKILKYKNDTELSKQVWKLKDENLNPVVRWKILRQCKAYDPSTKSCKLCLNEKYEILSYKDANLLNKRSEMISKCRHRNRFLLSQFDTGD
jgi:hypothetical protein